MLTAIWQRLDRNPPLFFDDQLESALAGARERIFGLGLLRADQSSRSAPCWDCGPGYVGRVVWQTNARTGARVAYLSCRVCGPVEIDPDRLRQWTIDVPTLVAAVRDAGRICGTVTEVVPGHLWHLGNATWCGRRREAYFLRCIHDEIRPRVVAALATHPKAVLFVPTEAAAHKWGATTSNPAVALESVVGLGPDGLTFDALAIETRLADARPAASKSTRPQKRSRRTANMERVLEEVFEHLRAARAHAHAFVEMNCPPVLLDRPTQQDLARRCGLSETAVSRCFTDKRAVELRRYWDMALNLDQVMSFRRPY
jgi:hypothetical protein